MVQVLPEEGSIFGRIGKGLGEGIGQHLSAEADRMRGETKNKRLSQGLRELGKQPQSNNVFEQAANLAGVPGMTPEMLQHYLPLLQQQQRRQAFSQDQENGVPSSQPLVNGTVGHEKTVESPSKNGVSSKEQTPRQPGNFASPSEISNYKASLKQKPDYSQVKQLANVYLDKGLTIDPNEAVQLANREIEQNLSAQTAKNQAVRQVIDERLKLSLQGKGIGDFRDVSGDIQKSLIDQGEYLVNKKGYTPEQAAEEIGNVALELAKTYNKLQEMGRWNHLLDSSKGKISKLKTQRQNYEKYGYQDQFDDLATASLGITPLEVAEAVDPVKNREISKLINEVKVKDSPGLHPISDKTMESIVRNIKPDDNIHAIQYLLREKHIDLHEFSEKVRQLQDDGFIALTRRQKEQIERAIPNSFLGDFLFRSRK